MCLAAPACVISIEGNIATVDYGGVETKCRLETLTEEVAVGDYVLIHTGFAIRRLSPEDGEETLKLFDELAKSLEEESSPQAEPGQNPVKSDSAGGQPASTGKHEES
jgi:hydrogenase expression/formation protein HypC